MNQPTSLSAIEENFDAAVRRLSSKYVLEFVSKWQNGDEHTLIFTRQILEVEEDQYCGFILANLLVHSIVKSNAYHEPNATNKDLKEALIWAKVFSTYYNKEEKFYHNLHNWRGWIRLINSQVYIQEKPSLEPAVLYYWFRHLAEAPCFKSRFDLNQRFKEAMGLEISTFLFVVIGSWASSFDRELKSYTFTLNYLLASKNASVNTPSEEEVTKAINLLVCTPQKLRALEKERKKKPVKFRNYDLNYLRTYPLIKLDLHTSQIAAPFPDLLISQAINLIYFELGKRFGNDFNQWFGDVFEAFCKEVFSKSIKSTDELKKFSDVCGERDKNPDFLIINNETAIIIEIKTARIRKGVLTSDEEQELCSTLEHITKALKQIMQGKQEIKSRKLYRIKDFIGLIITFDDFLNIHQKEYDQSLRRCGELHGEIDMPWVTLDYKALCSLQPYLKYSNLTLSDVLRMIHQSDARSVIKKIQKQYPLEETQQSFLAPYLDELISHFLN